ncbi:MAG TPA: VTT domain-containing protein [Thermoanaerobaculia bacterium]|jgi:membrane-associated protein|nr:VTT domain-containing protein [Thermoanaerobaculia bacterium]
MIRWGGYAGLAAIIFSETGLMMGFFLPGDSLLVAAGLFAVRGDLNLRVLWLLLVPMAILGNSTGYAIGHRLGRALFARPSSRLYNRRHLIRTQLFYERHGGKTIVIAQFLPILRTFAPVVAGIAPMRYRRFISFNVFGAVCWIVSMTSAGYWLGHYFPNIAKRIELVMVVVIAVSLVPGLVTTLRAGRARRRSRRSFLAAMGEVVTALGNAAWERSPGGMQRLAAALPAPLGAGQPARSVDGPAPAVELVAAQSPPLAELSEAGAEVAGWELDERFTQACKVLCDAYGAARESDGRASWALPHGSLTLTRDSGGEHRLSLRVEPR